MFKKIMMLVVSLMILNGCALEPTISERIIKQSVFTNPPPFLMVPPSPLDYQNAYESDAEIFAENMRNLETSAKDTGRFSDLQTWIKSQLATGNRQQSKHDKQSLTPSQ